MSQFAPLPDPPYYAVIFTAQRNAKDEAGYATMSARMDELAARQPGYMGMESARNTSGLGITVSYWRDEASLLAWRAEVSHMAAQALGKTRWYSHYNLRVARVERQYDGPEGR